jgi:hypothetical protein
MSKFGKIISYLLPVIFFTVLMGFMAGCESKKAVTEENKAIIGRLAELWNTGNLAIADEAFDADFVNHDPNNPEVTNLENGHTRNRNPGGVDRDYDSSFCRRQGSGNVVGS